MNNHQSRKKDFGVEFDIIRKKCYNNDMFARTKSTKGGSLYG